MIKKSSNMNGTTEKRAPNSGEITSDGQPHKSPYERLSQDLASDQRCLKEITLGKRIGFYRIRGELGTGNFSQVKMGIHSLTKEKVAIKILDKTKLDQKTQRLLSREISSMEKLHHPNVVRLYEVVETLAKLYMVMEFAGGGELFNKISNEGKLPETEARSLFAQVVAAMDHLHDNNIIHRDLKAENVFFSGPRTVKVGDFGFSTQCKPDQALNTFCGSPPYAAPELFKDESYIGHYVDLWAMGIMLYFMVTGIMPFRAETVAKLKKCILDGTYTIPSYISDSCQFLIRAILRPVPADRFTMEQIRRSAWLEEQDFPAPHEPYKIHPLAEQSGLTSEENEARQTLDTLGITEEHFREAHGKEARSSITGTYRIVLHRIQKRNTAPDGLVEDNKSKANGTKDSSNPYAVKKESKFCVLL